MIKSVLLSAVALACLSAPAFSATAKYPDKSITPGLARADATVEQLCSTNWASSDKPVSASVRRDVLTAYNLKSDDDPMCRAEGGKKCRIDHLIARKLGGADVAVNLWPQRTAGEWSAPDKDKLEDCMHTRVCAKLAEQGVDAATRLLHIYQHDLVSDWIAAFKNVIGDRTETCSRS
jgi:hypothetical protein